MSGSTCAKLGVQAEQQKLIFQVDVYAVHRSKETLEWLRETYPYMEVVFVPGGCTGICQVAATVINRPLKHAIKIECANWTADETSERLASGVEASRVKIYVGKPELRDKGTEWLWNAWTKISGMTDSIKKGYENAGTLKAFDREFQVESMDHRDRLFPNRMWDMYPTEDEPFTGNSDSVLYLHDDVAASRAPQKI